MASVASMTSADRFRALHHGGSILVLPNPWDVGSARLLAHLGFAALATTSSGSAAARGLLDGAMGRDAALMHAAELVTAVSIPVSADLENGFGADPEGVAETIRRAGGIGLAGASVEDWDGRALYERAAAVERVRAAVEAASGDIVVTARAENHIRGVEDLADTIGRLQAYQEAGAEVLYAPGVGGRDAIAEVVRSVDVPVNVLVRPGVPPVAELAELGVRRVSVGGAMAFAAYGALIDAAAELRDAGTYGYLEISAKGSAAMREALG